MGTYNKILLILIGLAYLASPIDLIPDLFVPFFGLIDDTVLIGLIIYYLRFNRLPDFFNWGSGGRSSDHNSAHARPDGEQDAWTDKRTNPRTGYSATKKPHEILGIKKNATKDEIQAAFRNAAKQYHPDRVAGLGKELQELAHQKFIEIKDAYTRMMEDAK